MKIKEGGVMDIQKEEDDFDAWFNKQTINAVPDADLSLQRLWASLAWQEQEAKAQAVSSQLGVNSILHDIDCYFDNGLSNTERTTNNLLQSIYEKLSGEVKAQEPK